MLVKKSRIPVIHLLTIGMLPSFVKKLIYRMRGYHIAKGVKLNFGAVVIGKDVTIGEAVSIGFFTVVRARVIRVDRFVTIGSLSFLDTERIEIGEDSRIREQVQVAGLAEPGSMLRIGKRCCIMQNSNLNPTRLITMDDDSGIGGHCLLFTHASWLSQLEGFPVKFGPITIGKNVWIPWRVFITAGVTIGDHVLVGPNTVISQDIPSNSLAAGTPLKITPHIFKPVNENSRKKIIDEIFTGFMEYLNYHHFKHQVTAFQNGFEIIIEGNGKHHLVYLSAPADIPAKAKDSVLVTDYDHQSSESIRKNFGMLISLSLKERSGSGELGEEMARYFSRFGIRFNRID